MVLKGLFFLFHTGLKNNHTHTVATVYVIMEKQRKRERETDMERVLSTVCGDSIEGRRLVQRRGMAERDRQMD